MKAIRLTIAQLDAALSLEPRGEFDGKGHVIGCGEWANLWERHWGRQSLDGSTIKNIDEMRRRGRGICCRDS